HGRALGFAFADHRARILDPDRSMRALAQRPQPILRARLEGRGGDPRLIGRDRQQLRPLLARRLPADLGRLREIDDREVAERVAERRKPGADRQLALLTDSPAPGRRLALPARKMIDDDDLAAGP